MADFVIPEETVGQHMAREVAREQERRLMAYVVETVGAPVTIWRTMGTHELMVEVLGVPGDVILDPSNLRSAEEVAELIAERGRAHRWAYEPYIEPHIVLGTD